ncbi:hypothetical protein [Arthrobacter antibioticus]|nr:hypothetical protein [Arthrobacter sp. H35-MC1]MDJ0317852.1 hypothetical protein [Arthrobacter sp. H35-MC1]
MKSPYTDKLAAHIAATVATWAAPTPEQIRRVTVLLRPTSGDA